MEAIDSHVHVWKVDPERYPWAPGARGADADATVEMLWERTAPLGVVGAVLVQVIYYGWDNRYVAECLRAYPGRTAGVCLVDPCDPAAPDRLEYWVREHGFEGLRLSPYRDRQSTWLADPATWPLWERAATLGVTISVLAYQEQLRQLDSVVRAFPTVPVIIDHMGWPSLADPDPIGPLLALAERPNVSVKVTSPWVIAREPYPYPSAWPVIERVVRTFGPERCLAGTDWPMVEKQCGYDRALALYRREWEFLTDTDRAWLLRGTVLRLYPRSFAPLAASGGASDPPLQPPRALL